MLFSQKSTDLTILFSFHCTYTFNGRWKYNFICKYKKNNYLTQFYEIWNCYFLFYYVTRFPENPSESESRIVWLIGNRFLGSSPWFKTPTNWLSIIINHRNTTIINTCFVVTLTWSCLESGTVCQCLPWRKHCLRRESQIGKPSQF